MSGRCSEWIQRSIAAFGGDPKPGGGTQDGSSLTPLEHAEQLALDYAHCLMGDNAIGLLYRDGIKRYSVGILVLMIGVITPFT